MQFIVHFFLQLHPIIKLQYFCMLSNTESHCNGNTDKRNSWRQHLGFLQAGITCMKEQQERRSLRLVFYPARCGYRQLCHLGLYQLQNSGEPLTPQCTLTCSFIIDCNIRRTGSCQRKAALASSPRARQKTALRKHPDKMGMLLPAWQSLHDLESHRLAAFCLIRSLLPYPMNVPNCYLLKRHHQWYT